MESLFNREYGYEYTRYEMSMIKGLYNAKIGYVNRINGHISKINNLYIIRPTITTIYPYIICSSSYDIRDSMVSVYGRWEYDDRIIFRIEESEKIDPDRDDLLDGIIDYDTYLEILFGSSVIDERSKQMIAHMLINDRRFRMRMIRSNSRRILDRIKRLLPVEFLYPSRVFIKELDAYIISRPLIPIDLNEIVYDDDSPLTMDSIYVDQRIDDLYKYELQKFMISMHMLKIDIASMYDEVIEYIMSNHRVDPNDMNAIIGLSIADAKIHRQDRLEVHNVRFVIELLEGIIAS